MKKEKFLKKYFKFYKNILKIQKSQIRNFRKKFLEKIQKQK